MKVMYIRHVSSRCLVRQKMTGQWTARTVLHRHGTDHVPADTADVDPPNFDPTHSSGNSSSSGRQTAGPPRPSPNGPTSRCPTSTCRRTRSSSCRTFRKASRRTNLWGCFLSTCRLACAYVGYGVCVWVYSLDDFADIRTYTKCVLSRRRRTSRSWNTWTRGARRLPKTRCTTTSWMGRTKSRCVSFSSFHPFLHVTHIFCADHFREEVNVCSEMPFHPYTCCLHAVSYLFCCTSTTNFTINGSIWMVVSYGQLGRRTFDSTVLVLKPDSVVIDSTKLKHV